MTDLGYTDAMKLMELKKVTKDQANELIRSLPEVDAFLILVLEMLDEVYQNNIKVAELAITEPHCSSEGFEYSRLRHEGVHRDRDGRKYPKGHESD